MLIKKLADKALLIFNFNNPLTRFNLKEAIKMLHAPYIKIMWIKCQFGTCYDLVEMYHCSVEILPAAHLNYP